MANSYPEQDTLHYMKKQTKQNLIELLETSLATNDLNIRDLEESLDKILTSTNSCKKSPYIKALRELYSYVYNYVTHGDWSKEIIIEFIKDTIAILNTPLKELEAQEAAIQKQLELDDYHKELPLKLLTLLAEADELDIDYKVGFNQLKQPLVEIDGIKIPLNGEPYDYQYVKSELFDLARQQKEETQQKDDLIAAAKAKLTDEEKDLLGL